MNLTEAVKRFRLSREHYCKPSTADGYDYTLKRLCAQFGKRSVRAISETDLQKFMVSDRKRAHHITGKPLSPMTPRTTVRHLRIFFNFCWKKRWVSKNPAMGLKYPVAMPLMEFLTVEQVKHLMGLRLPRRERALVELLLGSGLRAHEVVMLCIEDVNLRERYIFVEHGKRDRQRLTGITKAARDALRRYIGARKSGRVFLSDSLKRSEHGRPLTVSGLRQVFIRLKQAKGLPFHVSPQILRASFAVHFLLNGGEEGDLQMLMGHSQMTQTLEYARAARQVKALRAHKRFGLGK